MPVMQNRNSRITRLRVLDLEQGASWEEVRNQYRRLVQKWHPDRYADAERGVAEERLKEINLAFSWLSIHYRDSPGLQHPSRQTPSTEETEQASAGDAPPPWQEPPDAVKPTRVFGTLSIVTALLLAIGLSAAWHLFSTAVEPDQADDAGEVDASPDSGYVPSTPSEPAPIAFFSVGSTRQEVLGIQGRPTDDKGDIWYYGNSIIFFEKGRVVAWQQSATNPLRVSSPRRIAASNTFISNGMNSASVREIQGEPSNIVTSSWPSREEIWEYGKSRIYFKNGEVVGWHNTGSQRLRVPAQEDAQN